MVVAIPWQTNKKLKSRTGAEYDPMHEGWNRALFNYLFVGHGIVPLDDYQVNTISMNIIRFVA